MGVVAADKVRRKAPLSMAKATYPGWRDRKLTFISIAITFIEIIAFASVIAVLALFDEPINHSLTARKITGIAWIFAVQCPSALRVLDCFWIHGEGSLRLR